MNMTIPAKKQMPFGKLMMVSAGCFVVFCVVVAVIMVALRPTRAAATVTKKYEAAVVQPAPAPAVVVPVQSPQATAEATMADMISSEDAKKLSEVEKQNQALLVQVSSMSTAISELEQRFGAMEKRNTPIEIVKQPAKKSAASLEARKPLVDNESYVVQATVGDRAWVANVEGDQYFEDSVTVGDRLPLAPKVQGIDSNSGIVITSSEP